MIIKTHEQIDPRLCGTPLAIEPDFSRVELKTDPSMTVDHHGLVHGGFIFGLADYAAMIAVNDPNVVLGSADVKFLKPVRIGESVVAEASVTLKKGKKQMVSVIVTRNDEAVFTGEFACFVLEKHVLA
ncbi:MAG: thioesterase [Desulfobacteraceae bacterium]|nr:MAG: thioesterase [Desulfobacteraceae bacterium]